MTSYDRVHRPEHQSFKSSSLNENQIPGWIEGIIVDVNDPDGEGRVKVQSPSLSNILNLPLEEGFWARVGEEFTLNEMPGGSHRNLEVGLQVAMSARLGDPRQLLVTHCIHSKVDRVAPVTNRGNGTSGTVTRSGVMKLDNDRDSSSLHSYPHGVKQKIRSTGDIHHQTKGGATSELLERGGLRVQNMEGAFTINSEGSVDLQNSSGAINSISPSGDITVISASGSTLSLSALASQLVGPGTAADSMKQELQENLESLSKISPANSGAVSEAIARITQSISALQGALPVSALASALASQASSALLQGLPELQRALTTLLSQGVRSKPVGDVQTISGRPRVPASPRQSQATTDDRTLSQVPLNPFPEIWAQIQGLLPQGTKLTFEVFHDICTTLAHDPSKLIQSLIEEALALGTNVSQISSAGVLPQLETLDSLTRAWIPPDPRRPQAENPQNTQTMENLQSLWPEDSRGCLTQVNLDAASATSNPVAYLLAQASASLMDRSAGILSSISTATPPTTPQSTEALKSQAIAQVAPLLQSIPGSGGASALQLTGGAASLTVSNMGLKVQGGAVQLGASSALGGGGGSALNIGEDGAQFSSDLLLSLITKAKNGISSALHLDDKKSSLKSSNPNTGKESTTEVTPEAVTIANAEHQIQVTPEAITIANAEHQIQVAPDAVKVESEDSQVEVTHKAIALRNKHHFFELTPDAIELFNERHRIELSQELIALTNSSNQEKTTQLTSDSLILKNGSLSPKEEPRLEIDNRVIGIRTRSHFIEVTLDQVLIDGVNVLQQLESQLQQIQSLEQQAASQKQQIQDQLRHIQSLQQQQVNLVDEVYLLGAANWIPLASLDAAI